MQKRSTPKRKQHAHKGNHVSAAERRSGEPAKTKNGESKSVDATKSSEGGLVSFLDVCTTHGVVNRSSIIALVVASLMLLRYFVSRFPHSGARSQLFNHSLS